jgi:hypothetical protein
VKKYRICHGTYFYAFCRDADALMIAVIAVIFDFRIAFGTITRQQIETTFLLWKLTKQESFDPYPF